MLALIPERKIAFHLIILILYILEKPIKKTFGKKFKIYKWLML